VAACDVERVALPLLAKTVRANSYRMSPLVYETTAGGHPSDLASAHASAGPRAGRFSNNGCRALVSTTGTGRVITEKSLRGCGRRP
jgi:hypothetical protein